MYSLKIPGSPASPSFVLPDPGIQRIAGHLSGRFCGLRTRNLEAHPGNG